MTRPSWVALHNKLWKILQEMGILDHLTSPLRNQYAGQKATVRIEHEWTGPKWERNTSRMYLGVKYIKGCHPSCLTSMQSTSCKILGWMKHKLELRLPGEISITSDTHCDTTLMAQCEEELKSLLMKVKEENERASLKLNIQKIKIMASGLITSCQIDGETRETVTDFTFLGSKTSADDNCSLEIKRHLLLGRSAMTNLESILKSRDITNKGLSSQSYGFSGSHVWM